MVHSKEAPNLDPFFYWNVEKKENVKNIIYGDTDSIFIHLLSYDEMQNSGYSFDTEEDIKKTDEELVQPFAKKLNEFLKESWQNDVLNYLNIEPEFNTLDFKTEIVLDAIAFFSVKKKYFLNLVKEEEVVFGPVVLPEGLHLLDPLMPEKLFADHLHRFPAQVTVEMQGVEVGKRLEDLRRRGVAHPPGDLLGNPLLGDGIGLGDVRFDLPEILQRHRRLGDDKNRVGLPKLLFVVAGNPAEDQDEFHPQQDRHQREDEHQMLFNGLHRYPCFR